MTPKQIVLEKWPKSFAFKYRYNVPNHRWHIYKVNQIELIGNGNTPRQAWASAAETVRGSK